jgi:hypothetical protein
MNPEVRAELDALARGEGIERAAFLALLGDPQARADLTRLAQLRLVLAGAAEPDKPDDDAMGVTWEELARHAEGTLEESRQLAVERFLNRHFPEALKALGGDGDRGTIATSPETVADAPPPEEPPSEV